MRHKSRIIALAIACALSCPALEARSFAESPKEGRRAKSATGPKPWCGPDVTELSDHVCFFDGGTPADGRHTLVVYLHGALAMTPGFQYLQQSAMALHAKRHNFT